MRDIPCKLCGKNPCRCKERIVKMVAEEIPAAVVVFDKNAGRMIRLRIDSSSGAILTKVNKYYDPTEIDDWSDDYLRTTIRALCGLSPATSV
jgi:hypothetical protein